MSNDNDQVMIKDQFHNLQLDKKFKVIIEISFSTIESLNSIQGPCPTSISLI